MNGSRNKTKRVGTTNWRYNIVGADMSVSEQLERAPRIWCLLRNEESLIKNITETYKEIKTSLPLSTTTMTVTAATSTRVAVAVRSKDPKKEA